MRRTIDLRGISPDSPERAFGCSRPPDLPPLRGGEGGREDRGTGRLSREGQRRRSALTDPAVLLGQLLADPSRTTKLSREEATALAWEQYFYCENIIVQRQNTIAKLASTLLDSSIWHFWWD